MLLDTTKGYICLLLRGPIGRCPASTFFGPRAMRDCGLDRRGPLPARMSGMRRHDVPLATCVLFTVFVRRHVVFARHLSRWRRGPARWRCH
jgi:hypothetical protein